MSAFQQALAAVSTTQQQPGGSSMSIRGTAAPSARGLASALRGIKKDGTPGMEVDGASSSSSGRAARGGSGRGRRVTIGADGTTTHDQVRLSRLRNIPGID